MAVNCWVWPCAIDAAVGLTAMLTSTAGVTVINAVPEMSPDVAVMVVAPEPLAVAVANPSEPAALETVAVEVTDDDHVTEPEMLALHEGRRYVPVAVNCWDSPCATDAVVGATAILASVPEQAKAAFDVSASATPTTVVVMSSSARTRVTTDLRRPRRIPTTPAPTQAAPPVPRHPL